MEKNARIIWPFLLQFVPLMFVSFFVGWATTPTNVLNSAPWGDFLYFAGRLAYAVVAFAGIPIGFLGVQNAILAERFHIPTKVLSIANIAFAIVTWIAPLVLLCAMLFFGANH